MAKKKISKKDRESPKVDKELNGFDIKINSFGEIVTSYDLDKINTFLDKNVEDKKLKHRGDLLPKRNNEKQEDAEFSDEDEDIDLSEQE
jgi:hypothetical protein